MSGGPKTTRRNRLNSEKAKAMVKRAEMDGRKLTGRPPTRGKLDLKVISKLAEIGCSNGEIAALAGCAENTISNQCTDILEIGRAKRKKKIRELQNEVAADKNPTMLIWLGKCVLDQKESIDHKMDGEIKISITDYKSKT